MKELFNHEYALSRWNFETKICPMKPFAQSGYRGQIYRLRQLAESAVKKYPLGKIQEIRFIAHGENSTFRICSRRGQFLLRIHRSEYHSNSAIAAELKWLRCLASEGMRVPIPLQSKKGRLIETVATENIPLGRQVTMLHWQDGKFLGALTEHNMYEIGQLLGRLQKCAPQRLSSHRRYWTAEGLLGSSAKMGSLDKLHATTPSEQRKISKVRRHLLGKLKRYQKRFPNRMGLIHADLHTGNILKTNDGKIGAIDFDDCGFGFYAYDLMIPYISALNYLHGKKRMRLLPRYKDALIAGYRTEQPWDQFDDRIFPHMRMTRRLVMLGWINSRLDNPLIGNAFKDRKTLLLKAISEEYPNLK